MNSRTGQWGWMVMGGMLAMAGLSGAFWAGWSSHRQPDLMPNAQLLQSVMRPDSSSTGKSMSLASGRVMPDYEGLFMLDHKSGNLFCVLVNPRTGMEVGTFQTNVFVGLNLVNVAEADLVMTTGFVSLGEGGRVGNARPSTCICYVGDGSTGRVVGYGFQFNPQAVERNINQVGQLQVIWQGALRAAFPIGGAGQGPVPVPADGAGGGADPAAAGGGGV